MATATATMIVPTTTQPTLSMNISRLESVLSPCSAIKFGEALPADDENANDEDRDRDARHEQCGERDLRGDAAGRLITALSRLTPDVGRREGAAR